LGDVAHDSAHDSGWSVNEEMTNGSHQAKRLRGTGCLVLEIAEKDEEDIIHALQMPTTHSDFSKIPPLALSLPTRYSPQKRTKKGAQVRQQEQLFLGNAKNQMYCPLALESAKVACLFYVSVDVDISRDGPNTSKSSITSC
jgi:hypothetical protein